eukprot:scaffold538_cov166-Amphora_coffeaeformis.AAC.2
METKPTVAMDPTYAELESFAPPQDPVPEHYNPALIPAIFQPNQVKVLDSTGQYELTNVSVDLMPATANPTHAYAILPEKKSILLKRRKNWGEIHFAAVFLHYPDDPPHTFRAMQEEEQEYNNNDADSSSNWGERPHLVAIKKLNKAVVDDYLAKGGKENPYREICRYQELGDNVHVIRCEAMEDSEHLYIITVRCKPFEDEVFKSTQPHEPATIHAYVVQMLRILKYLEERDVHHRDLSPDNLLILPNGELVLADFAMSLRIRRVTKSNGQTQRTLMKCQGSFGTPAWMAPEIFCEECFDGVLSDLWCVMHITYNLIMKRILFQIPSWSDFSYRFFILAGADDFTRGVTTHDPEQRHQLVYRALEEIRDQPDARIRNDIELRTRAHRSLPPNIRKLFYNAFCNNPRERWTLGQVCRSDYVVHGPR